MKLEPSREPLLHAFVGARVIAVAGGLTAVVLFLTRPRDPDRIAASIGLLLLAALAFVLIGTRMRTVEQKPVQSRLAMVVGQRSERIARAIEDRCYLTLEFEDGTRREFEVLDDGLKALGAGDAGVAYLVEQSLIRFQRLAV